MKKISALLFLLGLGLITVASADAQEPMVVTGMIHEYSINSAQSVALDSAATDSSEPGRASSNLDTAVFTLTGDFWQGCPMGALVLKMNDQLELSLAVVKKSPVLLNQRIRVACCPRSPTPFKAQLEVQMLKGTKESIRYGVGRQYLEVQYDGKGGWNAVLLPRPDRNEG